MKLLIKIRKVFLTLPAVFLLLAIVMSVFYGPYIINHAEFVMDDFYHMHLIEMHGVMHPFIEGSFYYFAGLRIIPSLTLYLDKLLYGTSPLGYYFSNICILLILLCCTYLLIRRIHEDYFKVKNGTAALMATMLLVVHSEIGATAWWISNRTESLMLLFYVVSVLSLLKYLNSGSKFMLVAGVLAFVLSVFSKSQSAHLPILFASLYVYNISKGKGGINHKQAIVAFTVLTFIMSTYIVVVVAYDDKLSAIPWLYIPEKLMAAFGIGLIGIMPTLAEHVYGYFVHNPTHAYFLAVFVVLLSVVFLWKTSKLKWDPILWIGMIYIVTLFPRISYVVYERTNTIQTVLLITLMMGGIASCSRKVRWTLFIALFITYTYGSLQSMTEWEFISSNDRYRKIIKNERGVPMKYYKIASYQIFDPYAMHYARYGAFGYDSSFHNSPVMINRKYGSYAGLNYEIYATHNGFRYISKDDRTVFFYDSLNIPRYGIKLKPIKETKPFEYSDVLVEFSRNLDGLTLVVERELGYEAVTIGISPPRAKL